MLAQRSPSSLNDCKGNEEVFYDHHWGPWDTCVSAFSCRFRPWRRTCAGTMLHVSGLDMSFIRRSSEILCVF